MENFLQEQDVAKSYRILNLGATTLIGSCFNRDLDYMAAAWAGICDFDKGYAIIAHGHYTRELIERSGHFVMCYPGAGLVNQVLKLGTISKNNDPQKMEHCGIELMEIPGFSMPVVKGCVAYLDYEVCAEHKEYEMIVGRCKKVVTDSRAYSDNHWHLDDLPEEFHTLHYVAGGHFYQLGKEIVVPGYGDD